MTASIIIVNTSNHDEDIEIGINEEVVATLKRGETFKTSVAGMPREIDVCSTPRGTEYLGELEVEVGPPKPKVEGPDSA